MNKKEPRRLAGLSAVEPDRYGAVQASTEGAILSAGTTELSSMWLPGSTSTGSEVSATGRSGPVHGGQH
jgi:hypothetical protein